MEVFSFGFCVSTPTHKTLFQATTYHTVTFLSPPLSLSLSPFLFLVPNKWFLRLDLADISIVRKRFYDFLQCHVALPWPWVRHSRRVLVLALVFSSFLCYFIFNLFFFISLYSGPFCIPIFCAGFDFIKCLRVFFSAFVYIDCVVSLKFHWLFYRFIKIQNLWIWICFVTVLK